MLWFLSCTFALASIGNIPTATAPVPRIALPKGEGRSGNVKIDYRVLRSKKEHTPTNENGLLKKPTTKAKKTQPTPSNEPERHHTLFWGRANPPHAGHEEAAKMVRDVTRKTGGTGEMVLTRTQDAKKNPLTPEQKLKHARTDKGHSPQE